MPSIAHHVSGLYRPHISDLFGNSDMKLSYMNKRSLKRLVQRVGVCLSLVVGPMSLSAYAADSYSLDYGIDTEGGKEGGTIECGFNKMCEAKVDSLRMRLDVLIFGYERTRANIYIYGDVDCCFFESAARTIAVNLHDEVHPMPFYKGHAARGDMFVQNKRVGTLYLKFNSR
jgi:hypothetical protein